jgi:hypothetical protein
MNVHDATISRAEVRDRGLGLTRGLDELKSETILMNNAI